MQHARVSGLFYYQVIGYSSERVLASYYSILLVTAGFLGLKNGNFLEGKNVLLTLRVTSYTTTRASNLLLGSPFTRPCHDRYYNSTSECISSERKPRTGNKKALAHRWPAHSLPTMFSRGEHSEDPNDCPCNRTAVLYYL